MHADVFASFGRDFPEDWARRALRSGRAKSPTIVLGLALQSTLNDVFSGLVLSLSRPYRPGDWISIEGGTEGQVIEMNWRATHILTSRRDLAIVPNSTIAKSKILNVNFPSNVHGITIAVQLDSRTPPASGTNILELAVLNSRSILAFPRPTVRVTSIDASHTGYEVTFFVEQLDSVTAAQNELFDLIFRHVTAAGAQLAAPKNGPYPAREEDAVGPLRPRGQSSNKAGDRVLARPDS